MESTVEEPKENNLDHLQWLICLKRKTLLEMKLRVQNKVKRRKRKRRVILDYLRKEY